MALLQVLKSRAASRKRKAELIRARGLAGTPAAAGPDADLDEFSAPEGPFGRADVATDEQPQAGSGMPAILRM